MIKNICDICRDKTVVLQRAVMGRIDASWGGARGYVQGLSDEVMARIERMDDMDKKNERAKGYGQRSMRLRRVSL